MMSFIGFVVLWFFLGFTSPLRALDVSRPLGDTNSDVYELNGVPSREVFTDEQRGIVSQILTLDDLSLTHLQNAILSYDSVYKHLYAYYPTIGYLERYSGFDSLLTIERIDTLLLQGEQLNVSMEVKSKEDKIIMWEAAIGRVYEYDLNSKQLTRIDDSRVRDFMFGSGSIYVDSLGIYAFGGYGMWEHKNILLKYDFSFREWTKSPEQGDIPEKSGRNWLWLNQDSNELFYMNDGKIHGRIKDHGYFNYGVYRFDLENHEWKKFNHQLLPRDKHLIWGSFRHNKSYSLDTNRNLAHIGGRLFINSEDGNLYHLRPEIFPNTMAITGFYDQNLDKWLFVGRNTIMDARNMWFAYATLDESMLDKVVSTSWLRYAITEEWLFVLLGLLVILLTTYGIQKLRINASFSSPLDEVLITEEEGQITVTKNNRYVLLTDEYVQHIWQIILEQKKKGDREMMMVDFDDNLFTVSNSTSYRSKMKTKLFDEINSGLKGYVIRAKRSNLDKRYKVIEINLDIITIG
jgi:hypothetical protein